ncbi:HPr family phosphocarrier protein [Paenibacillus larvae]
MQKEFTVKNPMGIHARPAGEIVKKASSLPCKITFVKGEKNVNAKSIVGVLALGLHSGDTVTVVTEGEKEEEALNEIGSLIESILE